MKVFVRAKPNSKTESFEEIDSSHFTIAVKEPPIAGRANAAIIRVLADHFHTSAFRVRLVSGFSSRYKIFEIFPAE